MTGYVMHKNYNSCLHILDIHVERGETSVSTQKINSSSPLFLLAKCMYARVYV